MRASNEEVTTSLYRFADFRTNMIRMLSVGAFYLVHVIHYYSSRAEAVDSYFGFVLEFLQLQGGPPISHKVHIAISLIALVWVGWSAIVHFSLFETKRLPWLPLTSIFIDVGMLTGILVLTTGAQSPMICGYLLIVMLSALRANLGLVRWSTVACLAGLLIVLGATKWPTGLLVEQPLPALPRHHQLMIGLNIALAGMISGQWVRQSRWWLETKNVKGAQVSDGK